KERNETCHIARAAEDFCASRHRTLGWWNGRHVRLRGVCRKACGFKSRPEHAFPFALRRGPTPPPSPFGFSARTTFVTLPSWNHSSSSPSSSSPSFLSSWSLFFSNFL